MYPAGYLAYRYRQSIGNNIRSMGPALSGVEEVSEDQLVDQVQRFMAVRFDEGYAKGPHDLDAARYLRLIARNHREVGLLRYSSEARSCSLMTSLHFVKEELQKKLNIKLNGLGLSWTCFLSKNHSHQDRLQNSTAKFVAETQLFDVRRRGLEYTKSKVEGFCTPNQNETTPGAGDGDPHDFQLTIEPHPRRFPYPSNHTEANPNLEQYPGYD